MAAEKLQGLVHDMSSEDYHSYPGTWSSSQLKKMNEDAELFHRLYIKKTEEKETNSSFDVGTYFHTATLEPHKLKGETAVYEGIRRGKEWEAFQVTNKGKTIVTKNEKEQAEALVGAVKNSPIAMNRIGRGKPEVSAFVDVIVSNGEVYAPHGRLILSKDGWKTTNVAPSKKHQVVLPLKVRADLLAETFILDLKSMTGNAKSEHVIKTAISKYSYDLSASLYLDIFTIARDKLVDEFLWTFASKDIGNCQNWKASLENKMIGRVKWRKAAIALAENIRDGWVFEDSIREIGPNIWEREHLMEKGSDLL